MLVRAVKAVTEDKRFKLPSPQAADAFRAASAFCQWCTEPEHNELLTTFAEELNACNGERWCGDRTISYVHQSQQGWNDIMYHGDEEGDGGTETWTNLVDRGGLWHMNHQTYRLMEYSIRQRLTMATASKQEEGARSRLIEAIMACVDVKFQWCLLATEMEDKIASALLKQLVSLYVTIRGFAFVSSCIKLYKQARKHCRRKKYFVVCCAPLIKVTGYSRELASACSSHRMLDVKHKWYSSEGD